MTGPLHLLGAGRAGTALVRLLVRSGRPVGNVVARTVESAAAAVTRIGAGHPTDRPADAFAPDACTFVALPESRLEAVIADLAPRLPKCAGAVALHVSGSLPAEALAPLRAAGIRVGSFHPLVAFADRDHPPESLAGATIDVDGDDEARTVAAALAHELGARILELPPDGKALFHAAACVASNAFVALFDLAERLADAAGAPPLTARSALAHLAGGTAANLARLGSPAALTGPIERGEVAVVERHLAALARRAPALLPEYLEASRATLRIARRKGSLSPAADAALARLLAGGDSAPR